MVSLLRRLSVRVAPLAVTVIALSGCNPAEVDGTIQGRTLEAGDSISTMPTESWGSVARILIIDKPDACGVIDEMYRQWPGYAAQFLDISLAEFNPERQAWEAPTRPGTYHIVPPQSTPTSNRRATVLYMEPGRETTPRAASGSVELYSVSEEGAFDGHGDVVMTSGDHITFDFNSTPCAALDGSYAIPEVPSSTPMAAWSVSLVQQDWRCKVPSQKITGGELRPTQAARVLGDVMGMISCMVDGSSSFTVRAQAIAPSGAGLTIEIPEISPDATKDNPAQGHAMISSPIMAGDLAGACSFYFIPGGTVAGADAPIIPGKVRVAFTCPGLSDGSSMCTVEESYAYFENCTTSGN